MWHTLSPREYVKQVNSSTPPKIPKTFQFQSQLPHLPVPSLQETCAKYLKTVQPAVTPEQFQQTKKVVENFAKAGGQGEKLQKQLEEHAQQCNQSGKSWLETWWLMMAYHAWQDPIVLTSNWYCVFRDHPLSTSHDINQITRATELAMGFLHFFLLIQKEQLPIDTSRKQPLCMDQVTRIYSTTRIPGEHMDHLVTYPPSESRHVVVMRKDQIFAFDVVDDKLNLISQVDLQFQLKLIMEETEVFSEQPPVGLLTAERRDTWAKARTELEKNPKNKETLDLIDRALFVLCLDESSPKSRYEVTQHSLHNYDGRNRWFDKSFNLIVFKNGTAGLNAEHSPLDAPPLAHGAGVFSNYYENAQSYLETKQYFEAPRPSKLPKPKKLTWELPSSVIDNLRDASKNVPRFIQKYDTKCLEFDGFGSDFLKQFKLSPDAFIQMVIQLAYYKIHRSWTPTYETAQTRKFFHGRTETVRTLSNASVEFVKGMENPNLKPLEKAKLLHTAITEHVRYMSEASEGKGVDRHLLGLMMCSKLNGEALPEIYTDPAFTLSRTFRLSTSNLTPAAEFYGGFGPMYEDGYAVCYALRSSECWFSISSMTSCHHTDTLMMERALLAALEDLKNVCLLTRAGKETANL